MKLTTSTCLLALLFATHAHAAVSAKVSPSFGPPKSASSWTGYMGNAINLVKTTSTLPTGDRTGPTDVRLLQANTPEDVTTSTVSFYRGVFNPPSPWENERGGLPWEIVDVTAPDGSTVALADITGKFTSTDSANALGKTSAFPGHCILTTQSGSKVTAAS